MDRAEDRHADGRGTGSQVPVDERFLCSRHGTDLSQRVCTAFRETPTRLIRLFHAPPDEPRSVYVRCDEVDPPHDVVFDGVTDALCTAAGHPRSAHAHQ